MSGMVCRYCQAGPESEHRTDCPDYPVGGYLTLALIATGPRGARTTRTLEFVQRGPEDVRHLRELRGECIRPPFGWACALYHGHDGPCPTTPRLWNISARWRMRTR